MQPRLHLPLNCPLRSPAPQAQPLSCSSMTFSSWNRGESSSSLVHSSSEAYKWMWMGKVTWFPHAALWLCTYLTSKHYLGLWGQRCVWAETLSQDGSLLGNRLKWLIIDEGKVWHFVMWSVWNYGHEFSHGLKHNLQMGQICRRSHMKFISFKSNSKFFTHGLYI